MTIFLPSLLRWVYVSSMNTVFDSLYSMNSVKYCLSVVWSFFLYLNFRTLQICAAVILLIMVLSATYSLLLRSTQMISQYWAFTLTLWFLKSRLLKEKKLSLMRVFDELNSWFSMMNQRSSSVSYVFIRVNQSLLFFCVKIEISYLFVKKSSKFILLLTPDVQCVV